MIWQYGLTTVPARYQTTLPRTLASLAKAGFPEPRLFVDCVNCKADREYALENLAQYQLTMHEPSITLFGNWMLSLWELFLREPNADRYAVFQDDFVTLPNLREYLERCSYPAKGYLNLYTMKCNADLAPTRLPEGQDRGWYKADQRGKGAVALVFNREAAIAVMTHHHMIGHISNVSDPRRRVRCVDGGIVTALNKAGWREYVHFPTLTYHTGEKSTNVRGRQPQGVGFPGEDYDALRLLSTEQVQSVAENRAQAWVNAALGCVERRRRMLLVEQGKFDA